MQFEIGKNKIIAEGCEFDCSQVKIGGHVLTAYNDWFISIALPIWRANGIIKEFAGRTEHYFEIGVNCGISFAWAIENLLAEDGVATGVDPYGGAAKHRVDVGQRVARELCLQNLRPYVGRFTLWEQESQRLLTQWKTTKNDRVARGESFRGPDFDLVYVDGSHFAPDALLDMMLAFEFMRENGVMIVDDYNRQFSHGAKQVRPAANAFFECYSNMLEPVFITQQQIAFRKKTSRGGRRERRRKRIAAKLA